MLNYKVEKAETHHLEPLAQNMRAADRREVWLSHGFSPLEALRESLSASQRAWTALIEGEPVIIWGVGPDPNDDRVGLPWMLATNGLAKGFVEFIRQSRHQVAILGQGFQRLENYVHSENILSRRWLGWCGFTIDCQHPIIISGAEFYHFYKGNL